MKTYESVFISPPDTPPQKIDGFVDKLKSLLTSQGGESLVVDKWGRRRLAYPIRRHREGFYVHWQFKAPPTFLAELNQLYRLSEDVIRHLVCVAVRPSPVRATPPGEASTETAAPVEKEGASPSSAPKEEAHDHAPSSAPAQ